MPSFIESITKKCMIFSLSENQGSEELSSYGEIQSEWHEGSPDWAFAPPLKHN